MVKRGAFVASVLFVSLALIPSGAHLLALPNSIAMSASDYLAAQQSYRGWEFAGVFVVVALVATAVFAASSRNVRDEVLPATAAFACLALSQILLWTLSFPANVETGDWTRLPPGWERLRLRWEIGHALAALLTFVALACLLIAFARRDARVTSHVLPYATQSATRGSAVDGSPRAPGGFQPAPARRQEPLARP